MSLCLSLLHLTPSFPHSKCNCMCVDSHTASEAAPVRSENGAGSTGNFLYLYVKKPIKWSEHRESFPRVYYCKSFSQGSYSLAGSDYHNLKAVLCQLCAKTSSGRKRFMSGLFSLPSASPCETRGRARQPADQREGRLGGVWQAVEGLLTLVSKSCTI